MISRRWLETTWSTGRPRSWCPAIEAASILLMAALCPGCYERQEFKPAKVSPIALAQQVADKPADLKPLYQNLLAEGQRNAVLNQMRVGLRAMELACWDDAAKAFDAAIAQIETVYADNEAARKARSLYYEEGLKDFKGEPYERCMAYYYRGLLYLRTRDLDNAAACFKSGILQDAFAEEEQNRCDFAALIFLEGWAAQQAGRTQEANELYREVKRYRPDFQEPSAQSNVLIIAETGTSPRKVSDGVGHSELKFRRGRSFTEKHARASLNGQQPTELFPMEDVMWQASSRGGRAVDKILKGKAQFRQMNEQMGTVLTDVSSTAMISAPAWGDNMGAVQGIGAAVGLVGVVQMVAAARAQPHADTRFWNNLPDGIHVTTSTGAPGPAKVRVDFIDDAGAVVAGLSKEQTFDIPERGTTLVWLRSREGVFQEEL